MIDMCDLAALDFAGKRVTVVGLGIEGVDLVRYLARQGAHVTVSDSRPADKLADRIADVAGLPVQFSLGSGLTYLFNADLAGRFMALYDSERRGARFVLQLYYYKGL